LTRRPGHRLPARRAGRHCQPMSGGDGAPALGTTSTLSATPAPAPAGPITSASAPISPISREKSLK
jgi:hypothetical protein